MNRKNKIEDKQYQLGAIDVFIFSESLYIFLYKQICAIYQPSLLILSIVLRNILNTNTGNTTVPISRDGFFLITQKITYRLFCHNIKATWMLHFYSLMWQAIVKALCFYRGYFYTEIPAI